MTRYEVELTDDDAQWTQRLTVGDLYPADSPKRRVLNAVFDAVRANPPKPPRMDEPGWGEKVIAATGSTRRRPLVRWSDEDSARWADGEGYFYAWPDLIDPEPWRAEP